MHYYHCITDITLMDQIWHNGWREK